MTSRTGVAASRTQAWNTGSPGFSPSAFSQQTADHFMVCPSSRRGGDSASRTASAPPTRSTAATSRACTRAERVASLTGSGSGAGVGAGVGSAAGAWASGGAPSAGAAAAPSVGGASAGGAAASGGGAGVGVLGWTGAVSPFRTSVNRE